MTAPLAPPPAGPPRGRITTAERPTPLPAPPRSRGEVLRDAAEEGLFQLRRFAAESWQDFRRRDRFFRWKALIVAGWTVVSIASIRVAMAGPEDPAANGLGAYVAVNHTSMGWGLLVHNRSDEEWTAVRVELEGGWVHERPRIGPDEKVVLSPGQFRRGDLAATDALAIGSVEIDTDEGSATPPVVR
ncbi:hypothetical protein [Vulgatibacter sp.]|uniref:hypothetical protein n=1 Tax=Vulgatibacter sp. TaxID=1971226 RepID=UPI0035653D62